MANWFNFLCKQLLVILHRKNWLFLMKSHTVHCHRFFRKPLRKAIQYRWPVIHWDCSTSFWFGKLSSQPCCHWFSQRHFVLKHPRRCGTCFICVCLCVFVFFVFFRGGTLHPPRFQKDSGCTPEASVGFCSSESGHLSKSVTFQGKEH